MPLLGHSPDAGGSQAYSKPTQPVDGRSVASDPDRHPRSLTAADRQAPTLELNKSEASRSVVLRLLRVNSKAMVALKHLEGILRRGPQATGWSNAAR